MKNIFESEELEEKATVSFLEIVQKEDKRNIAFYNLDAIIALGYRVNGRQTTRFRVWTTKVIIKGFVLEDERLKQGIKLCGNDYFEELSSFSPSNTSLMIFSKDSFGKALEIICG